MFFLFPCRELVQLQSRKKKKSKLVTHVCVRKSEQQTNCVLKKEVSARRKKAEHSPHGIRISSASPLGRMAHHLASNKQLDGESSNFTVHQLKEPILCLQNKQG